MPEIYDIIWGILILILILISIIIGLARYVQTNDLKLQSNLCLDNSGKYVELDMTSYCLIEGSLYPIINRNKGIFDPKFEIVKFGIDEK